MASDRSQRTDGERIVMKNVAFPVDGRSYESGQNRTKQRLFSKVNKKKTCFCLNISQMLHVWYIYLHLA